ncbi:hypothetical protein [Pseudofrankia inefficax]|uniref:DUF1345 domain-containing protein n=1 Tax=Pseudofrankia inefficax (strain DSM 45817 / CECT 9037 / DDB 130130 / EuI1c) TaxID=298654 RepID=E3J8D7_PSEI1|nr:hypothetical protein [Pseudofrankia inefficax]ADP84471.1 hypothetical protein FraEuI1c_6492 [Pseudofrankia inefficax]
MNKTGEGGPCQRRRAVRAAVRRLPAAIATAVAIGIYALLPAQLILGPRLIIPILEGGLLASLVAVNPRRMARQTRWSRAISLGLVGLIALTNLVALGLLIRDLVAEHVQQGRPLLLGALQVWLTNIIVFGLAFWELDRGGPVARTQSDRSALPPADFRFSQDENHDTIAEVARSSSRTSGWVPSFIDYLYVSTTNSTAFSPTDTMPLTSRAKLLMALESIAALLTSILVIARGVGILQ